MVSKVSWLSIFFYVVTLTDTVRRYVTIMTKDSRFEKASQESSSKVALNKEANGCLHCVTVKSPYKSKLKRGFEELPQINQNSCKTDKNPPIRKERTFFSTPPRSFGIATESLSFMPIQYNSLQSLLGRIVGRPKPLQPSPAMRGSETKNGPDVVVGAVARQRRLAMKRFTPSHRLPAFSLCWDNYASWARSKSTSRLIFRLS